MAHRQILFTQANSSYAGKQALRSDHNTEDRSRPIEDRKSRISQSQTASKTLQKGAVVLITGASSGIGQAVARELIGRGCKVYGAARRFKPETSWQKDNSGMICVQMDVTDEVGCAHVISEILMIESRLDAVVFSAGFGIAGAVEDTSVSEAQAQLQTNVLGTATLLPMIIRQMRLQKAGLLVFISSVAAALPIPYQAWYSASKAALEALALSLREELRPWQIRCMVVNPGDTNTGFTDSRLYVANAERNLVNTEKSAYQNRFNQSVKKMEKDEQQGMSAQQLARLIVRQIWRKNPPPVYTPGFFYKTAVFMKRFLPVRLVRYLIGRLYGG